MMKYALCTLVVILCQGIYGQRAIRFTDSLTLDIKRSWIDIKGSEFTELGANCSYGMEMTFYKEDNKVVLYKCEKGEWKIFNYTFEVSGDFGEHFIKFYRKKRVFLFFEKEEEVDDFRVEVQMISDNPGDFYTELSFFNLNDKTTRTLRSKDL
ncbi:MAG: hypothetical protein AB3N14_05925 [Flavobacteriaceae bacterium]